MFEKIREKFLASKYWKSMEAEVENSPYHQEANVAVHTLMVLKELKGLTKLNGKELLLAKIACLFHDAGKPVAAKTSHSKERGSHKAYHGHSISSARVVEDFFAQNPDLREELGWESVYAIMFMIERHQDYSMEKPKKLAEVKTALMAWGAKAGVDLYSSYKDVMRADVRGRIASSQGVQDQMLERTTWFLKNLDAATTLASPFEGRPHSSYLLIGAAGSGKSTWKNERTGFEEISLDTWRLAYARTVGLSSYADAYALCVKQRSKFTNFVNVETKKALSRGKDVVVDNTNLSRKVREDWESKLHRPIAVLFPISEHIVVGRQATRTDKSVPVHVVHDQYQALQTPWLGVECAEVEIAS